MNSTQIEFTIQTLNGETFSVKVSHTDVARSWHQLTESAYNKYGLDILKEAISEHNGADPVTQQLFCEKELTISDSLIPLANQLITLMIKPSFRIRFTNCIAGSYKLDDMSDSLHHTTYIWSVICYLYIPPITLENISIEVVGRFRDFFKIATNNIPVHHLVVYDGGSWPYIITTKTPKYVWLLYDKKSMKIEINNVLHQ
jgi:hypothetical protein